MKKALALVLALVLALSLGVSAFAALNVVNLEPAPSSSSKPIKVNSLTVKNGDGDYVLVAGEGGTYYVKLDNKDYKDVTVTASGAVSAKVVEYDPAKFEAISDIPYVVYNKFDKEVVDLSSVVADVHGQWNYYDAAKTQFKNGYVWVGDAFHYQEWKVDTTVVTDKVVGTAYADVLALCEVLNKPEKATKYVPYTSANTTLIEITVEDNYSAAYKEGTIKVSAKLNKKDVSASFSVIRDVVIFEYEQVKWAAANGALRAQYDGGYSDYETSINGYKTVLGADYDYESLRNVPNATVVPTTAFRAIVGEDLVVCAGNDDDNYVAIYDVAKGQKGVNFAWHGFEYYNAEGKKITDGKEVGKTAEVKFGYYGKQTIASDFDVVITPGCDYTDLLKLFGLKVEEEDVVTYYVLKDGKAVGSFDVDYADAEEAYAPVQLKIEGKAGDTLGEYSIALKAPAAPEAPAGEENPNTGAESVIGVVAAMAVVSVAAAAAVSLKK